MVGPLKPKCANCKLWQVISQWLGTPFRYGGKTPQVAADCTTFPLLVMEGVGVLPKGYWREVYEPSKWKRGKIDVDYLVEKFKDYAEFVEAPTRCGDAQVLFNLSTRRLHIRISLPDNLVVEALPDLGVVIGADTIQGPRGFLATLRFFDWGCER